MLIYPGWLVLILFCFICRFIAEKTIAKGDDFMGRLFYPLRSIPDSGEEKTFVIHSHSGKTQHGYVTVHLNIGAKRKKIPLQVLPVQQLITCMCNLGARVIHSWGW